MSVSCRDCGDIPLELAFCPYCHIGIQRDSFETLIMKAVGTGIYWTRIFIEHNPDYTKKEFEDFCHSKKRSFYQMVEEELVGLGFNPTHNYRREEEEESIIAMWQRIEETRRRNMQQEEDEDGKDK